MNGEAKVTSAHRDRLAVVYLRQSSMAQVREHTGSTARQYGLAEEAVRLGWARADVLVIDTDPGVSGRILSRCAHNLPFPGNSPWSRPPSGRRRRLPRLSWTCFARSARPLRQRVTINPELFLPPRGGLRSTLVEAGPRIDPDRSVGAAATRGVIA